MNPEEFRPPETRPEKEIAWFFYLTFGILIVIGIVDDFRPAKLGIFFFFGSWIVLLAIHEFGHACMARVLGWSVDVIVIGFGGVRRKFHVLGMPVELRAVPIAGFVSPRPRDLRFPRLKAFFIYAAGPGIEVLLVLAFLGVLGPETLLSKTIALPVIAAQSFCLAALAGVFFTLVPLPYRNEDGTSSWSDGLGMIRCWSLPDEHFRALINTRRDQNP